jgi:hypothetical protein
MKGDYPGLDYFVTFGATILPLVIMFLVGVACFGFCVLASIITVTGDPPKTIRSVIAVAEYIRVGNRTTEIEADGALGGVDKIKTVNWIERDLEKIFLSRHQSDSRHNLHKIAGMARPSFIWTNKGIWQRQINFHWNDTQKFVGHIVGGRLAPISEIWLCDVFCRAVDGVGRIPFFRKSIAST